MQSSTKKDIHVAYFSNQFADKIGHGISRYSKELYKSIKDNGGLKITPVAAWSSMDERELQKLKINTNIKILKSGKKITPICWTFADNPKIERMLNDDITVVHAVSLGYPISTNKSYMVTVHDIGPITHPQYFQKKSSFIMKMALEQMLKKADAIVCVSQATADDLSNYSGKRLKSERIHIIGEGVSNIFSQEYKKEEIDDIMNMPEKGIPYLLVTGKISPRKNVETVIKAIMLLIDKIPHHLVLVGGIGWDADNALKLINNDKIKDRIHMIGYVSDYQLKTLYQNATAYIHPSLFEGFGLTVLEAMACGCPVITSNIYSLPEVAGDSALLIDPKNVDELTMAIESVCTKECVADDLRIKGLERVKRYSWDKISKEIISVYRKIS